MLLIGTAWNPSTFDSGSGSIIPPNYGEVGSFAGWSARPPAFQTPEIGDPHRPMSNVLIPIVWTEYVVSDSEVSDLVQAGLIQQSKISPLVFAPPGIASVDDKDIGPLNV